MPGQDRIERMLREVWQRCRLRFEQELRPFEIALGACLNELFRDSTNWPERWSAFVSEWQSRGVLISEPSQRAIEELLDLVARKQPIPRDPSGRYFRPTAAARPAAPPPNNATSPNWPALTGPQREQIQGDTGLAWWYPIQPVVPGDQVWEYLLAAKARAARDKLLDFFLALQALGALADAEADESGDGLEAIQNQATHVRSAYDNYVASYIALQQRWLLYLQYQPFLGMYVAGLMRKVDAGLPPSVLGLHSKYERELLEVQAEIVKASNSLSTRVDVAYTVAVWTDRAITVIEAATFFLSAGAVAKTALTKALAAGATRSAAVNLAIRAGLKQAVVQAVQQLAIGAVLPEVLIAAGLDEKQVRQGLVLLDAAPMLLNLRTIHAEMKATEALGIKVLGADESGHLGAAGNTDPRRRSPSGKGDSSEPPPRTVTPPGDEPTRSRATDEVRVGTIDPIVLGESLGTFSITEPGFAGYPPSIPRPQGPFRVLDGAEYAAARRAANRVNQELRKAEPSKYAGHEIHEIQPVKFGGSPTDSANKIPVPTEIHRTQVTPWWNRFQRELNKTLKESK